jgi:hypothetical protein
MRGAVRVKAVDRLGQQLFIHVPPMCHQRKVPLEDYKRSSLGPGLVTGGHRGRWTT